VEIAVDPPKIRVLSEPVLEQPPSAGEPAAARPRPHLVLASAAEGGRPHGAQRRRVLVADDEPAMRVLVRVNLEVEGVEVLEARDGLEALDLVARERPDLVLLDVMMPGLDGWEVARRLTDAPETRDIPILFMTALAGTEDRRRGFEAGGVGYIVKPFDPILLGEKVNRTLELLEHGDRDRLRREMLGEA
jgi:putative two-component system response regulator